MRPRREIASRIAPVYRIARLEAAALVRAWQPDAPDPNQELAALRKIEADDIPIDLDAPRRGADWCRHGCNPLFGMECGICGYDGPGVRVGQADTGRDAEERD